MSEADIWIIVFDKLGFKFIDEYCGSNNINKLCDNNKGLFYEVYFNIETEEVGSVCVYLTNKKTESINWINKESFYKQHIDLFRDIKLEYLS
jgi:hypothetical protein